MSGESTYSVTVCYSDHLTSFGSFVINPPNLVNLTNIVVSVFVRVSFIFNTFYNDHVVLFVEH